MTAGKTITLTIKTFVSKVMSLLFNMPSRLVIAFLPRSQHLLISWLQSPSVQFSLSVVSDSYDPMTATHQASLSFSITQSLLRFMYIESVMLSNHLILYHPLLLLPEIFPIIRVFSNELALDISWPKYWSFSFNISPSNEYSGLISFRIDWFDLLAVNPIVRSYQLITPHS